MKKMQNNNPEIQAAALTGKLNPRTLLMSLVLLTVGLLLAACGDNTATTAPAATTSAATTGTTTSAATTAAMTTPAATTASAAATTSAGITAAVTTSAPTTAVATTGVAATAGTGASGTARITLPGDSAVAGTTLDISGEGFPPDSWLTVKFGPGDTTRENASLALTDPAGKFKTQLILSAYGDGSKIMPGKNTIEVASQDGQVKATTSLTIQAAPAPTPTK
jgi:hypothetical protein